MFGADPGAAEKFVYTKLRARGLRVSEKGLLSGWEVRKTSDTTAVIERKECHGKGALSNKWTVFVSRYRGIDGELKVGFSLNITVPSALPGEFSSRPSRSAVRELATSVRRRCQELEL